MASDPAPEFLRPDIVQVLRRSWHYVVLTALALWLLYRVRGILGPFVIGIVLAYVTDPFLDRLQARGWSRDRAITFVFGVGFLAFLLVAAVIVPVVAVQANSLVGSVGSTVKRVDAWVATMPGIEAQPAPAAAGESASTESAAADVPPAPPARTESAAESTAESASVESSAESSSESLAGTRLAARGSPPKPPKPEPLPTPAERAEQERVRREKLAGEWDTWYTERTPWIPAQVRAWLPKPDLGDPSAGLAKYRGQIAKWGQQVLATLGGFIMGSLGGLFKYVFTPFVTYYFMKEIDPIRRRVASWIPEHYHDRVRSSVSALNRMLGSYFRGQLTLMFLVFCTCLVVMLVVRMFLGVDNILLVAAVDGLFYAVPIAGAWIASLVALVVGYVSADGNPWVGALVMVLAIQVVNFVFDQIVSPKIAGDKVGLHPLVVIFAVLAGAALLGFVGMLVAVPVAAAARILLVNFMPEVLRDLRASEPASGDPPDDATTA